MSFSSALIGLGASALGGIFGGSDRPTGTSTTQSGPDVSPELQARIDAIFNRGYPEFPGERVAQPTENRAAIDPILQALSGNMQRRAAGHNVYQDRINELMNMTPIQVQVPTSLGQYNNAGVRMTGGYNSAPVTRMQETTFRDHAPWTQGFHQEPKGGVPQR